MKGTDCFLPQTAGAVWRKLGYVYHLYNTITIRSVSHLVFMWTADRNKEDTSPDIQNNFSRSPQQLQMSSKFSKEKNVGDGAFMISGARWDMKQKLRHKKVKRLKKQSKWYAKIQHRIKHDCNETKCCRTSVKYLFGETKLPKLHGFQLLCGMSGRLHTGAQRP